MPLPMRADAATMAPASLSPSLPLRWCRDGALSLARCSATLRASGAGIAWRCPACGQPCAAAEAGATGGLSAAERGQQANAQGSSAAECGQEANAHGDEDGERQGARARGCAERAAPECLFCGVRCARVRLVPSMQVPFFGD